MTPSTDSKLTVAWWPIQKPVPYGRNPRVAPEAAIIKVAGSLTEFGWRQPIVVDADGVIVVGHTRLLAAQRLGLEQVPVHVATDLSPEQVKAYRLMDNRSAQETSWDLELLPLELAELIDLEFDLALTGFEPDELAAFLAEPTEGLTDPDEVPELPEEPVSQPGDLYLLGKHRLLCGDSTNPDDVERLMAGK
ncbi:MAG TPA: ParB N-terminal domain-containing protein, partial [Coriobacteriia bacterium]|nr:ParB N-terminal domain-containing protein [Coriobacteriia bacterium]